MAVRDWVSQDLISSGAIAEFEQSVLDAQRVDCYVPLDPVHDVVVKKIMHKLAAVMNSNALPGEYVVEVPQLSFCALADAYMKKA